MPAWLHPLLDALPFGLQISAPLQLSPGQEPLGGLGRVLAAQLAWLVATAAIVALGTWRALRKVVINGG